MFGISLKLATMVIVEQHVGVGLTPRMIIMASATIYQATNILQPKIYSNSDCGINHTNDLVIAIVNLFIITYM